MNALVFGGNGFIGSHVVDQLLAAQHRVRVFDRVAERYRPPLECVEYINGAFGRPVGMTEALEGVDVVFHLVSTTLPSTSNRDVEADIEGNLVATVRLLEQMLRSNVKRIVFMSSGGTVYGNPQSVPVKEDYSKRPLCSYAIVKVAIEHYLRLYEELHGLEPVVLRGSNCYGPRQGHRGVQGFIDTALHSLLEHRPLRIWGDGSVVRDYIFVVDLARVCLLAAESNVCGVYNAGYGEGYTLNDIVGCIGAVAGEKPEVVYEPSRPFDVQEIVLDISLAKTTFGWKPECSLEEGIRQTLAWMKKHCA